MAHFAKHRKKMKVLAFFLGGMWFNFKGLNANF